VRGRFCFLTGDVLLLLQLQPSRHSLLCSYLAGVADLPRRLRGPGARRRGHVLLREARGQGGPGGGRHRPGLQARAGRPRRAAAGQTTRHNYAYQYCRDSNGFSGSRNDSTGDHEPSISVISSIPGNFAGVFSVCGAYTRVFVRRRSFFRVEDIVPRSSS